MNIISKVELENFTAFHSLNLDLSSGVNILIGVNGTGKTHLLKLLYAACSITTGEDRDKSFALKLRNIFSPHEGRMGRLARRRAGSIVTKGVITRDDGKRLIFDFSNHANKPESVNTTHEDSWKKSAISSAYIPVKEMLTHAPGFQATIAKRELSFEEIYADIISRAFLPKLMGPIDPPRQKLLTTLQKAIDGKVIAKNEHFFLKNQQGDLEFPLLSEGMRKLALIWLLIQNGTLQSGSVLFWDEPEANLNPAIMGELVEIILELQRQGVQVMLTSHHYVLLKEFELRKRPSDQILFHALFRDRSDAVSSSSSTCIANIDHNAIADTFNALYDRELQITLGGLHS